MSFGKRKSTISTTDVSTPEKRLRTDSNSNASPTVSSPWEAKRMKIDLIAAKAQVKLLNTV